jgi:hypothetical protein
VALDPELLSGRSKYLKDRKRKKELASAVYKNTPHFTGAPGISDDISIVTVIPMNL